jgi:hypothetical protein
LSKQLRDNCLEQGLQIYGALSIADKDHLYGFYGTNLLASFVCPQPLLLMVRELSDYKPERFVWECLEAVDEELPKDQWVDAAQLKKWYSDEKIKRTPWDKKSEDKSNESSWGKVLATAFPNLKSGREYRGRDRDTVYKNIRRKSLDVQQKNGDLENLKDFFSPEEDAAIYEQLTALCSKNFSRRKVPGLGNCAVASIAIQLGADEKELRQSVHAWAAQNSGFRKLLEDFPDDRELSASELIEKIGKDKEWVGAEFLVAASGLLQRTIVSVSPTHVQFYPEPENKDLVLARKDTIFVAYNGRNHYDCLSRTAL